MSTFQNLAGIMQRSVSYFKSFYSAMCHFTLLYSDEIVIYLYALKFVYWILKNVLAIQVLPYAKPNFLMRHFPA